MTKNPTRTLLVSLAAAAAVLGCATPPSAADVDKATADAIKSSFRAEGIAGMDRLVRFNVIAISGRAVEAAGDVDTLLLDKTGTITFGNRMASDFIPLSGVSAQELA